ncbi:MAG: insulinase family protein [Chroococcidiopsidaceae cyanobacterium CP_BM_ER_R8_30]|nr:insulinase family protein [Chroococcidiopsidaceae cyanobacterium CP_BM_ER_R8_30]
MAAPVFPATVSKLDNGLTFIHQYLPTTPVVVADVWLKAGAQREPENWSGMAHFLEHMIFKGTATLPPGAFDREIENRGGMTNAATSHDYAHYFLITAVPYLEETLPHLAELLLNAAIPESEFALEREVVLEEIRQAYDDPDWLGNQALCESVYPCHPYGRSVLGTEQELMQQSPEAMRCFHRAHYQPENMTVVIVGGIDLEPAMELVNQTFQQFQQRSCCPPPAATGATLNALPKAAPANRPLQPRSSENLLPFPSGIRRQELYLPRIEQARLLMAWRGPGVEQISSAYGLDLLSVILAHGRSSRLVWELREEQQLVQAINCDFLLQRESSLFTISAWLEPQHLEQVESLISKYLENLQNTPVLPGELSRCQRLLCNDYAFSMETPNQMASLYGYYNTLATAELAVLYPQRIQSFQSEHLQCLAQQYLSPQDYVVTILKPC